MASQKVNNGDSGASARAKLNSLFDTGWIISSTAPSDTYAVWLDSGNTANQAYPIRRYVNGAWTAVTVEGQWWDTIGLVISYGRPFVIGISGQSNAYASGYTNAGYTGDVSVDPFITYWDEGSNVWRIHDWANNKFPGFSEGNIVLGTTEVHTFSKHFVKAFNRSVRIVGTRQPGQTLAGANGWEVSGTISGTSYPALVNRINASGVAYIDLFMWVHGEAELGSPTAFSTYQDCWYDFISRFRNESFANARTKVLFYANGVDVATTNINGTASEGTARQLDLGLDPTMGYVRGIDAKESGADAYHFVVADRERMGAAAFARFMNMPGAKRTNVIGASMWNTFTGNRLASMTIAWPNCDSTSINFVSYTNNAVGNLFTIGYGAGGSNGTTTKIVGVGYGSFGRVNYEIWANGAGSAASSSDKVVGFQSEGTIFSKPVLIYGTNALGIGNTTNNVGDASLYFFNSGPIIPTNTISRNAIVSRSYGSFSYANLHFVVNGSGNNANIAADTKFWIGQSASGGASDIRFGFNLGATAAGAFIHGIANANTGANVVPLMILKAAAHTGAAANTEVSDILFDLNRSIQFAAGTVPSQRAIRVLGPTYTGASATANFTAAATVSIVGAPIASTNAAIATGYGLLVETANVGAGTTLSYGAYLNAMSGATTNYALGINGSVKMTDASNFVYGTTTGTKHGTATSQKQSFWNATPVVQPTTAIAGGAFVANAGTAVNDASTFDGYTIKQIIAILRQVGLAA